MTEKNLPNILIIGIGNPLMRDEGIGIKIIEELEKSHNLPSHVSLLDGGTAGYALIDYMKGYEKVIIVDAVRGGKKPGSIYRLTSEEIIQQPDLKLSGHQIDFPEVIHLAEKLGELPEMVLIGVEPLEIDYGMELSGEVKKVTASVIQNVLKETRMAQNS